MSQLLISPKILGLTLGTDEQTDKRTFDEWSDEQTKLHIEVGTQAEKKKCSNIKGQKSK